MNLLERFLKTLVYSYVFSILSKGPALGGVCE